LSGEAQTPPGISKEKARSGLTNLQSIMGLLLLLSAASGFYLLATDNSLWQNALSHAYGLIAIVIVDIVLGLMNLASSRGAYLPGLAAAVLAVVLQLGDIATAPQYKMTPQYFAAYLFGLPAFDLLLALQFAVLVVGIVGRPYATYLARRRSRRGRELDYTRRGFLKNAGILTGVIAVAAALSTVKLPTSNVLQSETTTTIELGAPTGSIAKKSNLKVNTPVYFEYPIGTGYANILMLLSDGSISAVSLYCTHLCCQLTWVPSQTILYCQCHSSVFDPAGKVLQGPAVVELPKIQLRIDNNGYIFPTGVSNPGPCQV
jgi:cytochrome b6-f complex iron-sulfur subunit